jgi:hypothetical protein
LWFTNKRTVRTWPAQFPDGAELRAELNAYGTFRDHPALKAAMPGAGKESEDPGKEFRTALRIHMAGRHRALIADSNFWAHPVVAEALTGDQRKVAEEAIADHPIVTAKKLEEADATIRLLRIPILAADQRVPQFAALGAFWAVLLFAAVLDLGCVLLFGEGLFLRLLGIAAVNRKGAKASRLRLVGRTVLAWIPCVVGAPLSMALWLVWLPGFETGAPIVLGALGIFTLLVLAAIAWAVSKPARSLQDIAAGTWLVPR